MMKKRQISALLALMLVMQICLAGCSGKKNGTEPKIQEADESIMLSNTVFPGMKMTDEQKKLMEAVQEALSGAEMDAPQKLLSVTNTTGQELVDIRFAVTFYDADGTCIGEYRELIDQWADGDRLEIIMTGNISVFERADISARFQVGDGFVSTGPMPLTVKNAGSGTVKLSLMKELPLRVKIGGSIYLATELEHTVTSYSMDTVNVTAMVSMYKESGKPETYEKIQYRVRDLENGAILDSSTSYNCGLQPGARFVMTCTCYYLEPNHNYELEIIGDKVEGINASEVPAAAYGHGELVTDEPSEGAPEETGKPEETPEPSPTPTPDNILRNWKGELDRARTLIDEGSYYEAALVIKSCEENYPDSKSECDALMEEIKTALKDKEPKTAELERHFQYQGGNEIRAFAMSGPIEMTVTDKDHPEHFVRFYIRQFETSEVYLPGGDYKVSYKVGTVWFGDDIGFGELCETVTYDDYLEFHTSQDNAWVTNYRWSPVL